MRGLTSLGYSVAMRVLFPLTAPRDAQCGFKAVSRELCDKALPCVRSNGWFFDSELLLMARYDFIWPQQAVQMLPILTRLVSVPILTMLGSRMSGFRIKEVPVHWVDDRDSRVQVFSTILEMALSLLELRFRFGGGIPPPARPPCPVWSGSRLWRCAHRRLPYNQTLRLAQAQAHTQYTRKRTNATQRVNALCRAVAMKLVSLWRSRRFYRRQSVVHFDHAHPSH